jgi:catechol 2,3-dioxygenase-like lactoylglutathione lyase family enzyme
MVGDLDRSVAFFRDVIGMSVPPLPEPGPYPWAHEPWHRDLHGLPDSPMRFATLTMPSALEPGYRMLVEPVQQGAIELRPIVARPQDPGAFTLIVIVRDIDKAFARARQAGVPVVTTGGAPIQVPSYGGTSRAVVLRDPDGQLVELVQLDPQPASTAGPDENVLGGRLRITVADTDRTLRLYRDSFGLTFEATTFADEAMNRLMGLSGARFRVSTTRIPGSNQHLEFLEVAGADRTVLRPRIQDPGAVRFQVTVRSLDEAIKMLAAAGPSTIVSHTGRALGPTGEWEKGIIDTGTVRWLTVTDLNNVYLILGDRGTGGGEGRGGRGGRGATP